MRKYELAIRIAQMHHLIEERKYRKALAVIQTLDIRKIHMTSDLMAIADVYMKTEQYDAARATYMRIYRRSKTRRILYRLIYLSLRTNDIEEAESYYEEFVARNPGKRDCLILRYRIDKARGVSVSSQIRTLEELKETEYMEEWAYELAKLYHRAGRLDECREECKDIILWFGSGEIVERAKNLLDFMDRKELLPYVDSKDYTLPSDAPNPDDTGSLPKLDPEILKDVDARMSSEFVEKISKKIEKKEAKKAERKQLEELYAQDEAEYAEDSEDSIGSVEESVKTDDAEQTVDDAGQEAAATKEAQENESLLQKIEKHFIKNNDGEDDGPKKEDVQKAAGFAERLSHRLMEHDAELRKQQEMWNDIDIEDDEQPDSDDDFKQFMGEEPGEEVEDQEMPETDYEEGVEPDDLDEEDSDAEEVLEEAIESEVEREEISEPVEKTISEPEKEVEKNPELQDESDEVSETEKVLEKEEKPKKIVLEEEPKEKLEKEVVSEQKEEPEEKIDEESVGEGENESRKEEHVVDDTKKGVEEAMLGGKRKKEKQMEEVQQKPENVVVQKVQIDESEYENSQSGTGITKDLAREIAAIVAAEKGEQLQENGETKREKMEEQAPKPVQERGHLEHTTMEKAVPVSEKNASKEEVPDLSSGVSLESLRAGMSHVEPKGIREDMRNAAKRLDEEWKKEIMSDASNDEAEESVSKVKPQRLKPHMRQTEETEKPYTRNEPKVDVNDQLAPEDLPTTKALHKNFSELLQLIAGEPDPSHFVLMGHDRNSILGVAKSIIRVMNGNGFLTTSKIAEISGEKVNKMDLLQYKHNLKGCCLLVENAAELLIPTIAKIFQLMDELEGDFVVILADEGKILDQLFCFAPSLARRFKYIIDVSSYTVDDYKEME